MVGRTRFLLLESTPRLVERYAWIFKGAADKVNRDMQSYLIDVIHGTGQKKDGESMCIAFCGMIDKAENEHGCIVVCLLCDNDGGSQKGRKLTILLRPWLFGLACCAHQVNCASNIFILLTLTLCRQGPTHSRRLLQGK